jgi:uncharacterized protein (TIRG00374 family)
MISGRIRRLILGATTAALFVWLTLRHIELQDVAHAFCSTDPIWIVAALVAFAFGYSCRIERWRLMLKHANPSLTWRSCAGPLLASFAANNILPFRAGDVLRIFAFSSALGASSGVVLATLLVERLLDLLMVLLALSVALAYFQLDADTLAGVGSAVLATMAAGALIVLLFPNTLRPVACLLKRAYLRALPSNRQFLDSEVASGFSTLQHLAGRATLCKLVVWSLLAWMAEGLVFGCAALSVTTLTTSSASWLAMPVGTLATLIPSTPGYVGTFDYFTARAMMMLGNTPSSATAYAVLVHTLLWLPATSIGGLYYLLHLIKRSHSAPAGVHGSN